MAESSWRAKAARMGEELSETGRVVLHSKALERSAECGVRLLLGAVLSGGRYSAASPPSAWGWWPAPGLGYRGCAPF